MILSDYRFSDIPLDKIVKLGQRSMLYRDMFTVSWIINRYCPTHCSYCWSHGRSDTKDFLTLQQYISAIDSIKSQARERNYNSFHFSLSGGEPTFNPHYLDMVKHLNDDALNCNYHSVHMTTNMMQTPKWFESYVLNTEQLNRVSVTASWHREIYPNIEKWKQQFVEKLIFLQRNNVQVTINMVMVPGNWEALWKEAIFFHENSINVTLKPQSNTNANAIVEGYTPEMLDLLHNGLPQKDFVQEKANRPRPKPRIQKDFSIEGIPQTMQIELEDSDGKKYYMDQAERFNAFNFNNFLGWKCESGYRSIIIRAPGNESHGLHHVKRSYSCTDKPLGDLVNGFVLFDEPTVCISKACISSADSKIPKYK